MKRKSTQTIPKEEPKRLEAESSAATQDHPFKADAEKAYSLFLSLDPECSLDQNKKWNFEMEQNGVKVYSLPTPSGLPIYRGDGMIQGVTVQEILSVIRSPNARQECETLSIFF